MERFLSRGRDLPALEINGVGYSFGNILSESEKIEGLISSLFSSDDCVLVSSENPFFFVATLAAFQRLKIIFCCWNGQADITNLANLVGAVGYIQTFDGITVHTLPDPINVLAGSGDLIITTSGSTGQPKGVSLKLDNVIANAEKAGKAIELKSYGLDEWCIDIDFSLMSAISHMFMAWDSNLKLKHLKNSAKPEKNKIFSTRKAGFGGAPMQLAKLSADISQFHDGCILVSSGDFLTPGNLEDIRRKHTNVEVCTFYGLTEAAGRFCFMDANDTRSNPGSAGRPIHGEILGIGKDEIGEVTASTNLLYEGYYRQEKGFEARQGLLLTGDMGRLDSDGYLWLEGRANDSFKVSGIKVNRLEIESTLKQLLQTINYCILPVEHKTMGSCCALFIENTNACSIPPLREIISIIKNNLPSNCIPVHSYILDIFPQLANGKLDKQLLIKNHQTYKRYQ
jgi:acyl-CoA synthetase (AMP-forming)/AMP-acid ligase II